METEMKKGDTRQQSEGNKTQREQISLWGETQTGSKRLTGLESSVGLRSMQNVGELMKQTEEQNQQGGGEQATKKKQPCC